ncbi:hypothetical protein I0C86_19800 [Plantactinospora sp. S1510]|uniref:SWIM-type domain-containing protein n=1 Tax=Plantactinospora alkalitolerans TaxID=2789879 RepID=A0ABS0GZ84_9ACTN|nr:hypothetical protein [Plantactinospora alkalitolerans]MBF9131187.1 hypothetical protein [Plantactinospora alkalitolerans]
MTAGDPALVDAAQLLASAIRHLGEDDSRRPIAEIPTLDERASRPFRPFPALAIAIATHVITAWELKTFQVERADQGDRIRYFTAIDDHGPRLRACTVFVPELGTQRVVEMCGHSWCPNTAPAGPGSRCWNHLGDPPPEGLWRASPRLGDLGPGEDDRAYWLRRAADVARAKDYARGRSRAERLAVAAAGAGLPLEEVCRATGEAAWVVRALIEDPLPLPDDVDDADDADLWPLVLIPIRDITALDVRHVYGTLDGVLTNLAPDKVLARQGVPYTYFRPIERGPLVVNAGEVRFTLEWWQAQDHLPRHQLVARADEQRREMYRPEDEW